MKRTSSRLSASASSCARRRWPKWIGSKVPPSRPTSFMLESEAYLAVAKNDIFLRGQALQSDRAACMQLVGGDADLGTETVFEAVGAARRGVDHDRARIHLAQETARMRVVFGDDGLGMLRGVAIDVVDGLFDAADDLDRDDGIEIFGVVVLFAGCAGSGHQRARFGAAADFDA